MIQTPRLQLLPCTLEHFESLLHGNDTLADLLGINIQEGWTEYPEMVLVAYDKLRNDPSMLGWFFYLVIHREDKQLIGAGGFKGKPNAAGLVEMGYEIAPGYREKGLGTEMAKGLIRFAFGHSYVQRVIAHTEEEYNASVKILQKAGMRFVGTFKNKENEDLWEWEITRDQYHEE
ncbi:GNAT family N-acetyltransferase [Chitinophaga nivalis]|uniref:GNAT family N-acetyltransferase n=1 Tax=Chitinophaga nivalis TaxID=2991709 RepID=A0ABT3IV78_9BACT|nr:GNAT family N-acetyltransferase [Chitinophaga nivalis]MCW3462436.1 GNAT family N-acetyltransferase [Chitinophaga nivalis]MCW3487873.1 GNAT family N-acetyltransferase [Chitinophaga nivalis]